MGNADLCSVSYGAGEIVRAVGTHGDAKCKALYHILSLLSLIACV